MTASGERIAHYRLVRKLGAGGMGEVHRAVDEKIGRDVAIKLLPAHITRADIQTRLVREAQAAGQLNHPGIVTVHDVGIWRQRVYLVMELVDGRSLTHLARDRMSPREAVAICAEAATALAAAHRRGILHRDIKPDNIMLTGDGRVKILDFGLAKLRAHAPGLLAAAPEFDASGVDTIEQAAMAATEVESGDGAVDDRIVTPALDHTEVSPGQLTPGSGASDPWASLTFAGSLLGTPAYMSPEQAASDPVDARSDLYSLGLVLYELVAGKRPLARESVEETLAAARAADIPPLPPGTAPRPLVRLLARALAADPADRFADMDEFAAELRATETALQPRWRRRAVWLGSGALVAGGAAAIALVVARPGSREGGSPRVANSDFAVRATRNLTVDPGCEELPAFTRDGREILFDGRVGRDTEIQAISVDGKTRRRLTHSPGWDIGGRPSPDGRQVAYIHYSDTGRELRLMGIEGDQAAAPITVGPSRGFPAWTRDGALIYGDDSGRLWRVIPGEPLRRDKIGDLPADHIPVHLDSFPDGEIAATVKARAEDSSLIALGGLRPDGRFSFRQPPVTVSDCCDVQVDRGGRGLYHVARTANNSSTLHWRPRGPGAPVVLDSVPGVTRGFDVAPAGDRLVVSNCAVNPLVGRIEHGEFQPLPRFHTGWDPAAFDLVDPGWMVVSSSRSGVPQIWRVSKDGQAELIVEAGSRTPALSGDGGQLAWAGLADADGGIYLRAMAGGPIRRLTTDASDGAPAFSHDQRRLFFARTTAAGVRIHAVRVDGTGGTPPVSPPGVIAFTASREQELLAIGIARGDRQEILLGPPGGPFDTISIPGAQAMVAISFAEGDREILVAPRSNVIVAVRPEAGDAEPRLVWTAGDDTLYYMRTTPRGELFAVVSADEGDLLMVDGAFR